MYKNNSIKLKIPLWQKITLIIFSLFLFLILLEIGLRLGGFIFLSLQEHKNTVSVKQKGTYRIMCLGESTTASGGRVSYPVQLEKVLNERNAGIKFSVVNKGIVGNNSIAILTQLEDNLNKYKPDMVITMMGINDSGPHMPFEEAAPKKELSLVKSLRLYKLSRLLWLHIVTKAKETGIYRPKEDKGLTIPAQAEESFKRAIKFNPKDYRPYLELGQIYRNQGKYSQAEESFKKAIEFNPGNDIAYLYLGRLYIEERARLQAEESFKRAIELNPRNVVAYAYLGWQYLEEEKFLEVEEVFKRAIEFNPRNDRLYAAMKVAYQAIGKYESAQEYYQKANELRLGYYNPVTRNNYLKLKEILDKKGIKMVCVQYPVRSVASLNKIFEGQAGVVFVDNERVFKEALNKTSYKEYFIDNFAGDFGHCTPKGNRLLAENIADIIIKEYFNK